MKITIFGAVLHKEILFEKIQAFCLKQDYYDPDWVSSVKGNIGPHGECL